MMTNERRTTPYTVKELADAVNLSEVHIRRLLAAGEIVGQKIGRDWIVAAEEGQRFIASRRERWEKF